MKLDWDLLGEGPLAVAASGGADSFALLDAANERGLPVVALTVDHGLREGSAEDARVVADWCAERGLPHETLVWAGEKPASGVQAAARVARYQLLCEACERLGLDRLATGHTLDDQAETVFMRLRRGAGRGLAGMLPSRLIASGPGEPVALLRPMLGVRRAGARAYAQAQGLPVRDDPSNEDESFERVRVRALLAALEEQGLLTAEALGRTATEAARREDGFLDAVEHVFADSLFHEFLLAGSEHRGARDGYDFPANLFDAWVTADRSEIDGFETAFAGRCAQAIGGSDASTPLLLPRSGERRAQGGVVIDATTRGSFVADAHGRNDLLSNVLVYREPAALLGRADGTPGLAPVPAPPGSRHLYDRRFIVVVPDGVALGTELRPLGQLLPRDVATSTLARSRISTLPCLCLDGRVTHLPAAAIGPVWNALGGWKGREGCLPPRDAAFEARSLLAERFANEVIRY